MSPDMKARRLDLVAGEIDGARRLVTAGSMALGALEDSDERTALDELLSAIMERLQKVAADLREAAL